MRGRSALLGAVATLALLCCAPAASADWSGDGKGDVLAVDSGGGLRMYRGNGAGGFAPGPGLQIGSGWGAFTALLATDFSGDGKPDLLARRSDGGLLMYRGDGDGGFLTGAGELVGSGWQGFTALLARGDFSGDNKADVLARQSDGALLMYRGNGRGGWVTGQGERIGSGWQGFTALLAPGDFSGDGKADVLARQSDGTLLMYRGNGRGGWVTGAGERIGSGWQGFTALAAGGDFSGDGNPDVLARQPDGVLLLYRGNGRGGWVTGTGERIGSGWQSLRFLTLIGQGRPAPAPPPAPPPSTPLPDGRVTLNAGLRCTPPGGRLRVSLKVHKRRGHRTPRVRRVVFFVRHGPRKVDRRKPYVVRLRLNRKAGSRGRVYARVEFRRAGSRKLRHKTVWRRFVMCG